MRIQHNIMAMNAYRNYTNNTSMLSKNLEKLSSGYKINRAGDDAAGLAISEKMRAQITGLNKAQDNAQDGISLIQTAEGALTEVHDMLNRMVELSEQSANGTYEQVDRDQLQKEFDRLVEEIDRIADASNFNGIKLLDGSLSDGGTVGGASAAGGPVNLETELNGAELTIKDVAATKGSYTSTAFANSAITNGETMELTITLNNGKNVTVSLTAQDNTDGTAGGKLVGADGTVYGTYAAAGAPTKEELGKAMTAALKDSAIGSDFKVKDNGDGTFTLTNIEAGADAPQVMKDFNVTIKNADGTVKSEATNAVTATKGEDAYQTVDANQFTEYDGTDNTVLNIDGKKFAILVQDGTAATDGLMKKAQEAGIELIMVADPDITTTAGSADGNLHLDEADGEDTTGTNANYASQQAAAKAQGDTIAAALSKALGYNVTFVGASKSDGNTGNNNDVAAYFAFKKDTSINPGTKQGGGLTLQIGDTGEEFNQITVNINSIKSEDLVDMTEGTGKALADLDISDADSAMEAMSALRGMINYVSDVRGGLGATQNRLEHTINNLSVMEENIQNAESAIRDTDVAEEMMAYTKNNILIQSAQAMLAQANQVPQGVLQLLQ